MALIVTHTTAADGTFSSAGATAWNATHAIAGTLDLATETTGSLDLATRTTGSLDLVTRSTGTIDLLTQTRGATANQLMYGGASGQVAQSSGLVWDAVVNQLTVSTGPAGTQFNNEGLKRVGTLNSLLLNGFQATSGTSLGGGVNLTGGDARVNGNGGTVTLRGGNAAGSTGGNNGGFIDAIAGNASASDPTGTGGFVSFQAGEATGASAVGGQAYMAGGNAYSGATGGDISISGGLCYGSTGTPGNVNILVGGQTTGSVVGTINIGSLLGGPVAVTAGTGTSHDKDLPVIVDGVQYYIRLYS